MEIIKNNPKFDVCSSFTVTTETGVRQIYLVSLNTTFSLVSQCLFICKLPIRKINQEKILFTCNSDIL